MIIDSRRCRILLSTLWVALPRLRERRSRGRSDGAQTQPGSAFGTLFGFLLVK